MNGIPIPIVGNLTADPELRYTQDGIPVANFTIAHTPRVFDRQANEWKDGETTFLRTSAWREVAEHVAASLVKGQRVIAFGTLRQRTYLDQATQQNRSAYELELDEIGPSLKYGTTQFTKSAPRQQNAPAAAPVAQQGAPAVNSQQGQPQQQFAQQGQPQQAFVQQGQPQPTQQGYAPQQPAQGAPQQQYAQQPAQQPAYAGAAVQGAQAADDDVF